MPTYVKTSQDHQYSIFLLLVVSLISTGVFAQPVINSISPSVAPVGADVTITGNQFSPVAANNQVYFGAVRATVSAANASTLSVKVPVGATYQPVSVTVNGLTAYSPQSFKTTWSPTADFGLTSLENQPNTPTGSYCKDIAVMDFDGDGLPDLVTGNSFLTAGLSSVSILRNTSSGNNISFAPKLDITTGGLSGAVAVADIDGDGKPDIISGSVTDENISVYRNTSTPGTLSFAPKVNFPGGDGPDRMSVADFDGDGRPDLAVVHVFSNAVTMLRNTSSTGAISFAAKIDIATGLVPISVASGDIDGDGKADLAVISEVGKKLAVFRNTSTSGNISFAAFNEFPGTFSPDAIAIGDIDGDNKLDIAVSDNQSTVFSVYRNTSSIGSVSFATRNDFLSEPGRSITLGEMNGDGKPDLIVAGLNASIHQNNSSTGNISFGASVKPFYEPDLFGLAVVDLNGDGKNDFVGSMLSHSSLLIRRNRSNEPYIDNFTPAIAGEGAEVTISGKNLSGTTSVKFGGVAATSYTVVNATTIKAIVGKAISGDVEVVNPQGSYTRPGFTFTGPPIIQSFTPVNAELNTEIVITGINFYGVTAVSFGGVPAKYFTVVSASSIKATVDAGASGDVKVVNPWGEHSLPGFGMLPTIYSFSPVMAAPGATITISGNNLNSVTSVRFGGIPAASFVKVSGNSITAVVAAGASGSVSVANVHGTVSKDGFIFIDPPVITSFTPEKAGNNTLVTISGNYFTNASQVWFGDYQAASFTVQSPTTITARVGAATSGSIKVVTPGGTAEKAGFIFVPAPSITSYTPNIIGPGVKVTITGTNLDNTTGVLFGETPAASFTTINATTIEAIVANGNAGRITVNTLGGSSSTNNSLTFTTYPLINSFSPAAGNVGTTVTIYGANFSATAGNNTVYFGSIKAVISSASANKLVVTVPAGAITQPIAVHSGGLSFKTEQAFRVTFTGGGAFTPESFAGRVDFSTGIQPYKLVAGDIDGDGRVDLVVANRGSHSLSIYRNTSTGGNLSFAEKVDYQAGVQPWGIDLGDLDGDGKLDIAAVDYGGDGNGRLMHIFRNTSTPGTIGFETPIILPTLTGPYNIEIHDMSLDGKPDLVISNNTTKTFSTYENQSTSGQIKFGQRFDVYLPPGHPEMYYIGQFTEFGIWDMNNDNIPDVAAGNTGTDLMIFYGKWPWARLEAKALNWHTFSDGYRDLLAGDFNNDGRTDIITTHKWGTNTPGGWHMADHIYFARANAAAGDLDGDGKLDYIKPVEESNTVVVHKNNSGDAGDIYLLDGVGYATGKKPGAVCIADFNQDGKPDIAVTNFENNTVSILLNTNGAAPAAVINSFAPVSAPQGTEVVINGKGFTGVTQVYFGDKPASTFTVVSSTQIKATVGAGATGNLRVVTNTRDLSLGWFEFIPAPPTITSFTPAMAIDWATVTITGTNFIDVKSVKLGAMPAYTFTVNSPTSITATIYGGATGNVIVTTAGGAATATGTFTYINPPNIYAMTPNRAASLDTVILKGNFLTGVKSVTFGNMPAESFVIRNAEEIAAVVGAGADGTVKVSGDHGIDTLQYFTYLTTPVLKSFTPDNGPVGTVVTISGFNLQNVSAVKFGGVAAVSFTLVDDKTIKATVPEGGSGAVSIITPLGTISKPGFQVTVVTGIGDPVTGEEGIGLYPNPATTQEVTIKHPASVPAAFIRLVDFNGKVIKTIACQRQATQTIISIGQLARGVYNVIWNNGKKELSKTLLVP